MKISEELDSAYGQLRAISGGIEAIGKQAITSSELASSRLWRNLSLKINPLTKTALSKLLIVIR
jgi:hypothetical protein